MSPLTSPQEFLWGLLGRDTGRRRTPGILRGFSKDYLGLGTFPGVGCRSGHSRDPEGWSLRRFFTVGTPGIVRAFSGVGCQETRQRPGEE